MAVHLAVACDVFDCVLFLLSFSYEMSWVRSGTKLSLFLRIFLPNFVSSKLYDKRDDWFVGRFEFNGPLRQYFSLYRAVSQREGERGENG